MPVDEVDLRLRIDRIYAAMNRGDFDAALEDLDPDVEWIDPPEFPDPRPQVRGREAVRQVWVENEESFGSITFEIREYDRSGAKVLMAIRLEGSGKASGAEVGMHWYQIASLGPDGKLVRIENYLDRTEARSAAGLLP